MAEEQADFMEDVTLKIEELEDSFGALRDFTIQKLHSFNERIVSLEQKHTNDVSELRDELAKLSDNCSSIEGSSMVKTPAPTHSSTPCSTSTKGRLFGLGLDKPPLELDDIKSPSLRENLKQFVPKTLDSREKLSKAQVAFVLMWMEDNPGVKGRKEDGRNLFMAGVRNGMWSHSVMADGIAEPTTYLCEKIRTVIRKQKRVSKKKELEEDFNLIHSVLKDQSE